MADEAETIAKRLTAELDIVFKNFASASEASWKRQEQLATYHLLAAMSAGDRMKSILRDMQS